jgi:hypothetical protein
MNSANSSTNVLRQTAIEALINAYEGCSEHAVKESIITAFKAVIQLNISLEKQTGSDNYSEIEYECDPSELCAAV